MNELLSRLTAQLKGASGGTWVVAALVGVALAGILGTAAVIANRPDYQLAFSGLSDHEFPKVTKALADAGIAFRTSQPPAPFSIFVDQSDRSSAYRAVYGAGALDKPLRGILAESGVASVFSSSEERRQAVRKREWGEMEKMLEALDFVAAASVRTSPRSGPVLAGRDIPATSASVTLRVAENAELTSSQKETVANLVSRGLGVRREDLVVSDQLGRTIFDGTRDGSTDPSVENYLAHQAEYDARLTEAANQVLHDVLGPNRARVTVSSEWDYAQSTTHTEQTEGNGPLLEEQKTKTDRTVPAGSPPPAGISANALPAGGTNTVVGGGSAGPMRENTTDERRQYAPLVSRQDKVEFVPRLQRLSVALFLDQSLTERDADLTALEEAIKASVGYTEGRDEFRSVVFPFAVPETTDGGASPEEAPASNPLLERLLERGLEIVTGLVFIVLLLRSLKRAKDSESSAAEAAAASAKALAAQAHPSPEETARRQIEELLAQEPEKVGEILSEWIREDEGVEAAH